MAKKLHKSLRIYFSKLKKIRSTMSLPSPHATSSLLSACKYPKTPSFAAADRTHHNSNQSSASEGACSATLSDVDRFLFENFQSLYIRDDGDDGGDEHSSSHRASPDDIKPSDRFFASPRTSNSLADEARTSSASSSALTNPGRDAAAAEAVPRESVAVVTLSKEPYEDFRRSMQDMVDARHVEPGQALDWDFMEELLFCYLELNDRAVHKHILRAFADLTVSFRTRIPPGRRKVPPTATATARRRNKPPLTED